ncbi:MAG: hypothetical protein AB7Q16_05085 [Vicinamibacterales bacterium]
MRLLAIALMLASLAVPPAGAQTRKAAPAKKTTPASRQAPKKVTAQPAITRAQAELSCPSELGLGVATKRRFCDVLAGREPAGGVLVTIPPHRGPVTLSFELHNRHTYSEELVKAKRAFRQYTATVGVFTMDNTLIDRAAIQTEFRTERDLFDRVSGGAGPGGVKAVAPAGSEFISIELPADVGEQVSLVGEKLTVIRPDGTDTFVSEGRPIATISNVMVEYRPGPAPRKTPTRKP